MIGPILFAAALLAQGTPEPPGEMLRSYLTGVANRQLEERRAHVTSIRTAAELEKRRSHVKAALLRMLGGLPGQRGPLNVKVAGTLRRDGYRVEKVVFESLPRFYVTGSLYIPDGQGPFPAVLQPTGHSPSAKNRAFYQSLSLGLVKLGFVVLTYDPLGQGERRIFYDPDLGDSKVGVSTTIEHEMAGIQNVLAGESIARYMIWDGMRGLDLLSGLPYVDPRRIGVSGCSGGGTLTVYIAALDARVAAAAPACYVTDWEEQLKGTGPADAEQQFPGLLASGLSHADLVALAAPKPYLICSTRQDFFPLEGARKTFEESKRSWALLGAPEHIQWFVDEGGHGMPVPTREAIYGWMDRWLRNGSGKVAEPPYVTEHEEALNSTATGQVATSLGGETVSTLNRTRLGAVRPSAKDLNGSVRRLTGYRKPEGPVRSRSHGTSEKEGYRVERLTYWVDGLRYVPALLLLPARANGKAVVFADSRGKAAESGGDLDRLARGGYRVLSIDLEGCGETASNWGGDSKTWFGESKIAWLGWMVGRPLTGLHMEDISRAIDLLEERKLTAGGVIGFAKGPVGVNLLHAAVVDARLEAIAIENSLASYRSVVERPLHRMLHAAIVPDALRHYDLPDLAASLAPRPITIIGPRDPMGREIPLAAAQAMYRTVRFRREGEAIDAVF